MTTTYGPQHLITARHEAAHAVIGWLIGFKMRVIRMGTDGRGFVDMQPDYRARSMYAKPDFAPFALFLSAEMHDFDGGEYAGPLPAVLPPGGARAVADIFAVLLAGYASESEDMEGNYVYGMKYTGSDSQQMDVLIQRYPATCIIRDRLLGWLADFLRDRMEDELETVTQALLHPSDEARASWLGMEDLEKIREGFNTPRFKESARLLNARLEALAFLAASGWKAEAA